MPANPAPMVPPRPGACQHRLASVTGADAPSQTASTVERTLFQRRLALGQVWWRRFCGTRAARRPAAPVTAPDATRLPAHDQHPTTHDSLVGHVCCARPDLTTPGPAGRCPRAAVRR